MAIRKAARLIEKGNVPKLMLHSCCLYVSGPVNHVPSALNSFPCSSSASIYMQANLSNLAMPDVAKAIADQKKALRTKVRRELKSFSSLQRQNEDDAIQNVILKSSWFKQASALCAYISLDALKEVDTSRILSEVFSESSAGSNVQNKKKLYVPRVEDRNSNMRMLSISNREDLIANSMNILEPSPIEINGNPREDVMLASEPVDMFLLPGLAFDKSGRRLGRGGGYYDILLNKYQNLVDERKWKQPLLVALAYSVQVKDEEMIPITKDDVSVDALVTPSGVIKISCAALERM